MVKKRLAIAAEKEFNRVFKDRKIPSDIHEHVRFVESTGTATVMVSDLFKCSRSEVRRLIKQGAVRRDGEVITDSEEEAKEGIYSIGKRRYKKDRYIKSIKETPSKIGQYSKQIKDKNNKVYIVEIVKETFKQEEHKEVLRWSIEYKVKNESKEQIGFGSFSISCPEKHKHAGKEEAISALLNIGAVKVREDIDNEGLIESKGYHISVDNCLGIKSWVGGL
jgi:RNA-binding protein YlmH